MNASYLPAWYVRYRRWRRTVFTLTLIELAVAILIILVVVVPLIMKGISARANAKCQAAALELKNYARQLQLDMANTGITIKPEDEKKKLDALIATLKEACDKEMLKDNKELKGQLQSTLQTLESIIEQKPESEKTTWEKIKEAFGGILSDYFS